MTYSVLTMLFRKWRLLQQCWTKPSLLYHIRRWRRCQPEEAAAVEEAVVVAEAVEDEEVVVEVPSSLSSQKAPSIQISRQETLNGVGCIINGGKEVTFAPPPRPVRGRMSRRHALQNNEGWTSPTK